MQRLTTHLETLSAEFKIHHYSIIDLLDDEVDLAEQQEILDEHDDYVSQLTACLEKIVTTCSSKDSNQHRISFKRLMNVEKGLIAILDGTSSIPSGDDGICLLQQYGEQLAELKAEFSEVRHDLFSLDIEE